MFSVCALSNGLLTLSHFETNESSHKQQHKVYKAKATATGKPRVQRLKKWTFIEIYQHSPWKRKVNPPFGSFKKVSCFSSTGERLRHWWAQQQKNDELGNALVVARPPEVHSLEMNRIGSGDWSFVQWNSLGWDQAAAV